MFGKMKTRERRGKHIKNKEKKRNTPNVGNSLKNKK